MSGLELDAGFAPDVLLWLTAFNAALHADLFVLDPGAASKRYVGARLLGAGAPPLSLRRVPGTQYVTLVHEGGTQVVSPGVSDVRVGPNPFRDWAQVRFTLPSASRVTVTVTDAAGRRIRTLGSAQRAGGDHRVSWDGRDDAGARARAGLYVFWISTARRTVSARSVLLR